jgi:hypothetical protein
MHDVPVDSETPVGLCELQDLPAQSFESAHRGRVYVRVFIEVSVRAC